MSDECRGRGDDERGAAALGQRRGLCVPASRNRRRPFARGVAEQQLPSKHPALPESRPQHPALQPRYARSSLVPAWPVQGRLGPSDGRVEG
eukprot:3337976-Rhodomonas_salina.3